MSDQRATGARVVTIPGPSAARDERARGVVQTALRLAGAFQGAADALRSLKP